MTLIAIHLLQNHAPSNLNRDDNGDPKDALFGGVRRARISSQALKRSIRWNEVFRSHFSAADLSARRSMISSHVQKHLESAGMIDQLDPEVVQTIKRQAAKLAKASSHIESESEDASSKTDNAKEDEGKAQLVFLTEAEVRDITERLLAMTQQQFQVKRKKKESQVSFSELNGDELRSQLPTYEPHSVDIAMFGRMTTSSPFKNIEAAVQVAHAISTHAVEQEFDFFTAVDDWSDSQGAGLLSDTPFNSATYYKYVSVDWDGLVKNLHDDVTLAKRTVEALIKAALFAIPSGKQNSFAAHNLPDLALIEVRSENIALGYHNAFVKPVRAGGGKSLVEASAAALQDYVPQINDMYGLEAQRAFLSTVPFAINEAEECANLEALLAWLPLSA